MCVRMCICVCEGLRAGWGAEGLSDGLLFRVVVCMLHTGVK